MSTNAVRSIDARTARIDMKFEAVVIPVSSVDRAKEFYGKLGWRLDADFRFDNGFRVVQFTPTGSGCSVQFGANITSAAVGSAQGLYLIVTEIAAARDELAARGIEVQRCFSRGDAGRSVPARRRTRPRHWAIAQSCYLWQLRHVQRPGWQWLVNSGSHDAASGARGQRGDVVRVSRRFGERDASRGDCSRRARKAHRREGRELAAMVRRIHDCGAGWDGVAEVKDESVWTLSGDL